LREKHRFIFSVLLIVWVFCAGMPRIAAHGQENEDNYILITVKSTPQSTYESELKIVSTKLLSAIDHAKKVKVNELPLTDRYLTVQKDGKEQTYILDKAGGVFHDISHEQLILPDKWTKQLKAYGEKVAASHYGELLPWEEVRQKIPNKSKITIIDLESGLSFAAQRRAGKHHADVQPLTKSDTKIMKEIYQGKWSWNRKAILVQKDGHYYAASMQGMPHGGDGIPGNGFSGHFCVHFLGSRTHKSLNKDPEHYLMINKAAGTLDSYFKVVNPYELVDSFIGAVHLKETHLLPYYFQNRQNAQLLKMEEETKNFNVFRKASKKIKKEVPVDALTLEVPVEIAWERKGKGAGVLKLIFCVQRITKESPWKITEIKNLDKGFSHKKPGKK
jgi:hypothetical protein